MSTTPVEADPIPEADKPFYLTIIVTSALVALVGYSVVEGKWNDAKDAISLVSGLVLLSWGFYFKSKA
jgi:hypothetical protein